jgi:hypothetical protein
VLVVCTGADGTAEIVEQMRQGFFKGPPDGDPLLSRIQVNGRADAEKHLGFLLTGELVPVRERDELRLRKAIKNAGDAGLETERPEVVRQEFTLRINAEHSVRSLEKLRRIGDGIHQRSAGTVPHRKSPDAGEKSVTLELLLLHHEECIGTDNVMREKELNQAIPPATVVCIENHRDGPVKGFAMMMTKKVNSVEVAAEHSPVDPGEDPLYQPVLGGGDHANIL